ncbi:MAG: hypothetical protein QOG39_1860 [Acidimicrobiaceae bacterium]|jgi:hypothetical protein
MSTFRKSLLALLLFGLTATAIGAGTFASFSASTTNGGSTFATGTLVLSNRKDTGTVCFSSGGNTDTNTGSCDILFTQTARRPGATTYSANVTLKNEGSLDATALSVYRSQACATTNDAGGYHGTGDTCAAVQLTIDETDSSFTPTACVYDADNAGTSCAFAASRTLSHFSTTYAASGSALGLGAMTSGTSRYFKVSLTFPDGGSTDNQFQGRIATFGFTWAIV